MIRKTIKDFTKEDWDSLFPIKLIEHNPNWKIIFNTEKDKILQSTKGKLISKIEHFGSSSIPCIKSKPYIDILIEIPKQYMFNEELIQNLYEIGYTCLTEKNDDDNNYMILVKGYNPDGSTDQIFHLHICYQEHPLMDQLRFRDILTDNPDLANQYEELKIKLATQFFNDRSGYRIAKTNFIKNILATN